jgi:hypothetical protein
MSFELFTDEVVLSGEDYRALLYGKRDICPECGRVDNFGTIRLDPGFKVLRCPRCLTEQLVPR